MLDNECIQSLSPFIEYELQDQDDESLFKQTFSSVEISSQSLQRDKDENNISISWHGGHPE